MTSAAISSTTRVPRRLDIAVGFASERGKRPRNEDYVGVFLGRPEQRARHGVVAAIADGVGGGRGGRVAAELAVRGLIDGYVGEPATIAVKMTGGNAIAAVNGWIHGMGRVDPAVAGMSTTLTALVLRGRVAHVLHVGDTRVYRLRNGRLARLTADHVLGPFDMRNVLSRAVGGGEDVMVDYAAEGLQAGDRFLLCSDGVHGVLRDASLADYLARDAPAEAAAELVVKAALDARSDDNATALVVDVLGLPDPNLGDVETAVAALPILAPPKIGDVVDGYRIERLVADGRYTRMFQATDAQGKDRVVAKFPKERIGGDAVLRQAFVREHWIAGLVRSPWVGEGIVRGQSRLYALMPWYEGETLETRLARSPPLQITAGLGIAIKLVKGVAALHRCGIIHRDIKPDNIVLESNGGLRLIDLGVARVPHLEDFPDESAPGTPNYMAPELFEGARGDERSDIFAVGVTLFRAFAGVFPYNEAEAFARPSFKRFAPLSARRPDLPAWFCRTVERACAMSPNDRPGDAIELLFDFENGEAKGRPIQTKRAPLYQRRPVLVWQIVGLVLALALVISLATRRSGEPPPRPQTIQTR